MLVSSTRIKNEIIYIRLWCKLVKCFTAGDKLITKIIVSAKDPETIYCGFEDGTISIFETNYISSLLEVKIKKTTRAHQSKIFDLCLTPDEKYLISCSAEYIIIFRSIELDIPYQMFIEIGYAVTCFTTEDESDYVIVAANELFVHFYDIDGNKIKTIRHTDTYSKIGAILSCKVDGKRKLYTSDYKGTIEKWDFNDFNNEDCYSYHTDCINALAISCDDRYLISASIDKSISLMDQRDNLLYRTYENDIEPICLRSNPCFPNIALILGKTIQIYNIYDNNILTVYPEEFTDEERLLTPTCLCWSADGNYLIVAYDDFKIRIIDISLEYN